uniref:Retrotransposon gag domain-containing protein n=1 Tax=Fagus sylvatica TaxID=28930 RepID=A0A2N9H0K6_FAGSY
MSAVPSSSRHPHFTVQRESKSSAQKISSETPYKPSWHTETSYKPSWYTEVSYKTSGEATIGGTSIVASSQHTDPNDRSFGRTDRWGESKKFGSHNSDRGNARRSLKFSSTASQAKDSEKIISELRREIHNLNQEARGYSPAKERPRNRVNASKRKNPGHSSRGEDLSETSCFQSESRSPKPQPISRQSPKSGRHSRSRQPLHIGKGQQTKEHTSKKAACPGGQHAVWKAFDLVSSSPFSRQIERAELPERYTAPRFEIYNGRTDPVAHIGHYQQSMALSLFNNPIMCRLFPSSLGEVALRWFNQLGRRTINSWIQMAEAFVARFITNSRKTREMDALLTMKLEDNETIKEYLTKFWETYNDIDGCNKEVVVRTFKLGLPSGTGLRQSLTKRPTPTVAKLMHMIDQFIQVEKDGGGTTSALTVVQPKVITLLPLGGE